MDVLQQTPQQKVNKIQERELRFTCKDTESTFRELLQKDSAATMHAKNLPILMTEMYKTRNGLNPSFMQEIFCENTSYYNMRSNNEIFQPRVISENNGTESVPFKGPQLWQILPPTRRIHSPFLSLKQRYKDGTEKIDHTSYAASLFQTLAFYNTYFYTSILCCINFDDFKIFYPLFFLFNICILYF